MKVPIKHAIDSGAWFQCETEFSSDEDYNFRFKALSFERVILNKIEKPGKINFDEGIIWILTIEFVNLNNNEIGPYLLKELIVIVDQDDYIFKPLYEEDLYSEYGSGLDRFWYSANYLRPKIKVSGALFFLVPDEDNAEYYLSVPGGRIQEI